MTIKIDPSRFSIKWRDPRQLTAHPRNFRRHPETQRKVLRAALEEDGWIDPIIFNVRTGHTLDGHARIEEAISGDADVVPVIEIDVDEQTERRILARHDRIGALAEIDEEQLKGLLAEIEGLNLEAMGWPELDLSPVPDFQPATPEEQGRLDQRSAVKCPACGHEFIPN